MKNKRRMKRPLYLGKVEDSVGYRFTSANHAFNGASVDAEMPAPLADVFGNAINSDRNIASLVVVLLGACSPTTVFRRVVTFVINSINSVFIGRSLTHVSKEVFKRKPSFAKGDASSSVVMIESVVLVGTPLLDATPCFIDRRVKHSVRCILSAAVASARLAVLLLFKVVSASNNSIPALAQAIPLGVFAPRAKRYYGEFIECFASKVYAFHNDSSLLKREVYHA